MTPDPRQQPQPAIPTVTDPSAELSRMVRSWRERLEPAQIPGQISQRGNYPRRRRKTRLSQDDVARLIGVSSLWYGHLERGDRTQNYSDDFLDRTAYALRLNPAERTVLYLYAVGREPATDEQATVQLTDQLRRVVSAQPYPAYISNESWDVVVYNSHMRTWFPWVGYEKNVMRWVFTYGDARQQLHRWGQDWAPLMLAQMRMAHARNPENKRLASLIEEILASNEDARRLWETEPMAYVHPDGDRRQLHLPHHRGIKSIELVAMAPLRAPNVRFMMLLDLDDK